MSGTHYWLQCGGCGIERWHDVKTASDLDMWLEEKDTDRNGKEYVSR